MEVEIGKEMYRLAEELFPICRSLTGNGVRKTLEILQEHLPRMRQFEIPTGTRCFDWTIPKEWNIKGAYIAKLNGERILDFALNNLHVVSYSSPINSRIKFNQLRDHLHTIPTMPTAIPYITSYYQENWGFCLSQDLLETMKDDEYDIKIDSTLENGHLTYSELIIPGKLDTEVFLSTYICHPSMANNEVSGPVLATYLSKYILQSDRKFTYRVVFVPETIGAVAYLSINKDALKKNVYAGFQLTCVGDNRSYSYLPSRAQNTITDKIMKHVLKHKVKTFKSYTFLDRGSDERQYCAPGIDLPVASIMRSKYGQYPEYHTSLDNLDLVSPEGFQGSFNIHKDCIDLLENNEKYVATQFCEPQLGKHGLRPKISTLTSLTAGYTEISNFLAYADGKMDLLDIAEILNVYALDLLPTVHLLIKHQLLKVS
ncbi:MAG: DUF4910 domain-containing protein [Proteobacteria bacterium]|nr:DUF4910 domain-containing protein [Pseudomonadota bacterium]